MGAQRSSVPTVKIKTDSVPSCRPDVCLKLANCHFSAVSHPSDVNLLNSDAILFKD